MWLAGLVNLRLKGKIMVPLIVSLVFMLVISGYTIYETLSRKAMVDELTSVGNSMNAIAGMIDSLDKVDLYVKSIQSTPNPESFRGTKEEMTKEIQTVMQRIGELKKEDRDEAEMKRLERVSEALRSLQSSLRIEGSEEKLAELLSYVVANMQSHLNVARSEFANMLKHHAQKFFDYSPFLSGSMRRALLSYLILIPFAILVSVGIGLLYSRRTYKGIAQSLQAIERISLGEITSRIPVSTRDEIGDLAEKLNLFASRLEHIVGNVKKGNLEISNVVTAIKETEREMTERVERATEKIGSVAVASEEMAQTAHEIAQNSLNVVKSAEHSKEVAKRGFDIINRISEVMEETQRIAKDTSEVMRRLSESSRFIENVVSLIEDIADQTNLLALNAAIEAARAGDHGRGFAVVADEVRSLAERTIKATKDITESIRNIKSEMEDASHFIERNVQGVERATSIVIEAKRTLEEIVKESENVLTQINHVATASEEQSATVLDISNSITDVQDVVVKAAASFKNSSKEVERLTSLSDLLKEELTFFKLDGMDVQEYAREGT